MQFLFPVDGESGTQKDTLRFTESHLTRHSFLSATDLEGVFFPSRPPGVVGAASWTSQDP